jgi:septal ring factor EnvC (AmiA/AmiB activator)
MLLWADPEPRKNQDRSKDTEKSLAESEERLATLSEKEAPIIGEIEGLNLALNQLQRRERAILSQLGQIDQDIGVMKKRRERLANDIQALEGYAAKRLSSFYKLSRLGIGPIVFSSTSFFETQKCMAALERILESDAHTWETLERKKSRLDRVAKDLKAQKRKQEILLARCNSETSEIIEKRARRALLLERIRTEKDLARAALQSLKRSTDKLHNAVQSLKQRPFPAENSASSGPFLAQKGMLLRPAEGDLVGYFGPYENEGPYNVKGFRNGVNITAKTGSPVQAVWNGQVIYANWFKGYGNIIIIDHGAHYYTLSAQLDQILKETGDSVQAGETVGTVGDTATHGGPGLYFEIRHRGKPLDPTPWFKN